MAEGRIKPAPLPVKYRTPSLARARESQVFPVPSARPDRRYEFQVAYRRVDGAANVEGAIHHQVTGTLVERDATGTIVGRQELCTHESVETVD